MKTKSDIFEAMVYDLRIAAGKKATATALVLDLRERSYHRRNRERAH